MENWFLGRPVDFTHHQDWTERAINHSFWDRWWPVDGGVEAEVCDERFSIGGKLDALIQHRDTNQLAILDFKTKRTPKSSKKNYQCQLGGYASLIDRCHRNVGPWIEKGFVFFIFPDRVEIETYDMESCLTKYVAARDLFFSKRPTFDF